MGSHKTNRIINGRPLSAKNAKLNIKNIFFLRNTKKGSNKFVV